MKVEGLCWECVERMGGWGWLRQDQDTVQTHETVRHFKWAGWLWQLLQLLLTASGFAKAMVEGNEGRGARPESKVPVHPSRNTYFRSSWCLSLF